MIVSTVGMGAELVDVLEVRRFLKTRPSRAAPAVYKTALLIGTLGFFGQVIPAWRMSRYAEELSGFSFLLSVWWSFLKLIPGSLIVSWFMLHVVAAVLDRAIDRAELLPAEITRGPVDISEAYHSGGDEIGAALQVAGWLMGRLGFPVLFVEFRYTRSGARQSEKNLNFLFDDERIVENEDGTYFALVDPLGPGRRSWICRERVKR